MYRTLPQRLGILFGGVLFFSLTTTQGQATLPLRVDVFDVAGGYLVGSSSVPNVEEFSADSSFLGGERDLRVERTAGTITATAFEGVLGGTFTRTARGQIRMAWDGVDNSFVDPAVGGGARTSGLNLNAPALQATGVRLVFRSANVAFPLRMTLFTGTTGTHATPASGSGSFQTPSSSGAVFIPFSACSVGTGVPNLADVRGVEIAVSYDASSSLSSPSFELDRVEWVGAFGPPTALQAEVRSYPFVSLSWADAGAAVSYEISRNGTSVGVASQPRFTDNSTRTLKGQTLGYQVRAVAGDGTRSAWVSAASLRLPAKPLFSYRAINLGQLTGLGSNLRVADINRDGRIAANVYSGGIPVNPVFLEVQENLTYSLVYLPLPPGTTEAQVTALNNVGQAVGYVKLPTGANGAAEKQACFWTGNSFQLLGFLQTPPLMIGAVRYASAGSANAINDAGQVVGGDYTVEGGVYRSHPFVWQAPSGPFQRLDETSLNPLLPGAGLQVNSSGQITSLAVQPSTSGNFAALFSASGQGSLPFVSLPGWDVWGDVPLNNQGHVAAGLFVRNDYDITYQTHLADGSGVRSLPMLAAGDGRLSSRSTASALNDAGVVTGGAGFFETELYGYLFFDGVTYPVTELLDATSSDTLRTYSQVLRINEAGQALLRSWSENNVNSIRHSYLLRPILAGSSLAGWNLQRRGTPFLSAAQLRQDLDGNGTAELLDYALAKPLAFSAVAGNQTLFTFSRFPDRTDAVLTLQGSPDLTSWQILAVLSDGSWQNIQPTIVLETTSDPDLPGAEKITIRRTSGAGENRYFYRILAEQFPQ
jgi:hypothetical protein